MLNRAIMMGRLCADPELRHTQTQVAVCSLRIAVDRDYSKNGEKETDFFDVVAWRATAEFICKYFTKGRMIVVDGRMQTRPWTDKEGNKRTTAEVVASSVYFGDSKPKDGESAGSKGKAGKDDDFDLPSDFGKGEGDGDGFSEMEEDDSDLPF